MATPPVSPRFTSIVSASPSNPSSPATSPRRVSPVTAAAIQTMTRSVDTPPPGSADYEVKILEAPVNRVVIEQYFNNPNSNKYLPPFNNKPLLQSAFLQEWQQVDCIILETKIPELTLENFIAFALKCMENKQENLIKYGTSAQKDELIKKLDLRENPLHRNPKMVIALVTENQPSERGIQLLHNQINLIKLPDFPMFADELMTLDLSAAISIIKTVGVWLKLEFVTLSVEDLSAADPNNPQNTIIGAISNNEEQHQILFDAYKASPPIKNAPPSPDKASSSRPPEEE